MSALPGPRPTRPYRRHKFHAQATHVDGIRFASKAEATRYGQLRLLERAGQIRELTLQPRYPLHAGGTRIGHYVADFAYVDVASGTRIVEDVKGMDLPFGKWKRKHVKAEHGIDVRVVTR